MLILPAVFITLLQPFAPLFHLKTWQKAQILLTGAILTPRKRTVTSALRVMGLAIMAYSLDLRKRVVGFVENGGSKA